MSDLSEKNKNGRSIVLAGTRRQNAQRNNAIAIDVQSKNSDSQHTPRTHNINSQADSTQRVITSHRAYTRCLGGSLKILLAAPEMRASSTWLGLGC